MRDNPDNDDYFHLSGKSPSKPVGKLIRWGYATMGAVATVVVAKEYLGLFELPPVKSTVDYAAYAALTASVLLVGAWVHFVEQDLHVLNKWVRSRRAIFPTGARQAIQVFGVAVVLTLLPASSFRPVEFACLGAALFLISIVGFDQIRRNVMRAVTETEQICASDPRHKRLRDALAVIRWYWACQVGDHRFMNRCQQRQILLVISFAIAIVAFVMGRWLNQPMLLVAGYVWCASAIIAGEVVMFLWRDQRDTQLHAIEEEVAEADARG